MLNERKKAKIAMQSLKPEPEADGDAEVEPVVTIHQVLSRTNSVNKPPEELAKIVTSRSDFKPFDPTIRGLPYYLLVTLLYVITVAVAVFVGDLGPIFNVLGAVAANALSFLLPCIYYLRLTRKRNTIHVYASWLIIIVAGSLGILCIVSE